MQALRLFALIEYLQCLLLRGQGGFAWFAHARSCVTGGRSAGVSDGRRECIYLVCRVASVWPAPGRLWHRSDEKRAMRRNGRIYISDGLWLVLVGCTWGFRYHLILGLFFTTSGIRGYLNNSGPVGCEFDNLLY